MNCSKHSLSRHSPSTSSPPPRLCLVRGCSCWCGFSRSIICSCRGGVFIFPGGEADVKLFRREHIVGYSSPSSWSFPIVNSPLIHGLIIGHWRKVFQPSVQYLSTLWTVCAACHHSPLRKMKHLEVMSVHPHEPLSSSALLNAAWGINHPNGEFWGEFS